MRLPARLLPPPLLWLLLHFGAATPTPSAAPTAGTPFQLPAPQNLKIHLYNAEQVLSWEPVSLSSDERPVLYRVQFKYPGSGRWSDVAPQSVGVDCSRITATECNFAPAGLSKGFWMHFNVSLRVRAELHGRASAWAMAPWFQHYQNVTIGPPENIWVTPGKGSLFISLSPPFDVEEQSSQARFLYYVHYWEKAGPQQDQGPFNSNLIELSGLKPLRVYCLQVKAQLVSDLPRLSRPGHFSNVSCHETTANASTKLQQVILVALGTFLFLIVLAGACVFLILKYRGVIKYWFHTPPGIPVQIEEYLRDPVQPILEALNQQSTSREDPWDLVSVVSVPEE